VNQVPQLLRNHDVLALQEAGAVPPPDPNGDFHCQDSTTVNGNTIHHYLLRDFGHDPVMLRHVYFLETDPNGHQTAPRHPGPVAPCPRRPGNHHPPDD